jgi:hypothetical protein
MMEDQVKIQISRDTNQILVQVLILLTQIRIIPPNKTSKEEE